MANEVLIAHTGQRLQLDFAQFTSLDDFRATVTRQTSIPPEYIIALTPQGKALRLAALQTEKDICVYDGRTTQSNSAVTADVEIPLPKRFTVTNPPNELRDQRSLAAWQELFHTRQEWAAALADECASKATAAQERYSEMDAMMRCMDAAVSNLEAVVKGVQVKYTDLKNWTGNTQTEHAQLVERWESYLDLARNIPISPAMLEFMTCRGIGSKAPSSRSRLLVRLQKNATLEDLVDLETARKAGKLAPAALRRFDAKMADLERAAPRLFQGWEDVMRGFDRTVDRSALSHDGESAQLLQDIKAVANKIDTDYRTTLEYADSTRDVLQASKIAATHTERLLPSLKNRAVEMDEMYRYATRARNVLAVESVDFMRTITELTSLSSDVKAQLGTVNSEEDMAHFDYLRLVQQIPVVYASYVSEAIKRREWLDKVKTDSSTLANEMAVFHDEEVKRRKKWLKSIGSLSYGPVSSTTAAENQVAGLEVNLLGEEAEWPAVTRADLEGLYDVLQRQKADASLIEDIGKMMAELKNPTKQQIKRIKAFKNGSVHEAALGRSGLLIRGDDDVLRSLQDDKGKLESKLKTAESRVRRLEDLLHRQSQASRASIGGVFQPSTPTTIQPSQQFQPQFSSERTDSIASASATAAAAAANELRLVQRVQQLETDLAAEKERSFGFERELGARGSEKEELMMQMDDANSTKKDLLENLEALKNEFTEERKSLEGEIKRLQARLEDTEDEMEHFGESRENEKASYDEKTQALQAEIEQLTKEYRDDTLKNQGQVDFLRKETKIQRERTETLERQLQVAQDEVQAGAKLIEKAAEAESTHVKALRDLHGQLVANGVSNISNSSSSNGKKRGGNRKAAIPSPPADVADLIEAVSGKLADTLAHLQATAGDMTLVKTDLERSEEANRQLRSEVESSQEKLAAEEESGRRLRESLAEMKARVATLEEELAGSRSELSQVRARLADGETGSETLRKQLEDEEKKVLQLAEDVAAKQSQVGGLEEELRLFRERQLETQKTLSTMTARFDARTLRAKDLSQRLYTQNDRLCRLLERLGFAVTRSEGASSSSGSMTIQKVPRAERSALIAASISNGGGNGSDHSPAAADGTAMLRKSSGGPLASSRLLSSSYALDSNGNSNSHNAADLELLYWMNSPDGEAEAEKYAAYMAQLGAFDIDLVAETLYRRVKEVEHIARKLQRDVRGYREKAHTLQKEAHDKIAFKNFKEGDLALFLPTRNQTNGAWAAFNIGFPHYFLREQEAHRLQNREWLVARISRVQEKVVDLSGQQQQQADREQQLTQRRSLDTATGETTTESESLADDNDNPFDLSDGLRWYLIDAQEDKPGAPSTPGLGKSTVAGNNVEAVADIHTHARTGSTGRGLGLGLGGMVGVGSARPTGIDGVSKTLSRSLESRRSSTSSRKAMPLGSGGAPLGAPGHLRGSAVAGSSETNSLRAAPADSPEQATSPPGGRRSMDLPPSPRATVAHAVLSTSPETPRRGSRQFHDGVAVDDADNNSSSNNNAEQQPPAQPEQTPETGARQVRREESAASSDSPSKRSVVWDSLWAVDYSYESGKKAKGKQAEHKA